jgi:hypothetical protein
MDVSKIVTDTSTRRWSRRRFMGGAASVAALGSFATACSGGNQPASGPRSRVPAAAETCTSASPSATTANTGVDPELIRKRHLGLKPFAAFRPRNSSTKSPASRRSSTGSTWLYRHIQDQGFTVADITQYV